MAGRRRGGYDEYENSYFRPSRPRAAKGGIKAQSQRGGFGQSWWAKRWIVLLESFNMGARLGRGKSYARSGQVLSVAIQKGLVTALVQGSRARPYQVSIKVKTLRFSDWEKVGRALAGQARFAAKLLAGEMPQDIETIFTGTGLSLFPPELRELTTTCSCPDSANPCKHIAAVYYLLGEEFDRDPFLIFKLRGLEREELLAFLGGPAGTAAPEPAQSAPSPEPLRPDAASFWTGGELPADLWEEAAIPPVPAALPKQLGAFPFWRGEENLQKALEPIYAAASAAAATAAAGMPVAREDPPQSGSK